MSSDVSIKSKKRVIDHGEVLTPKHIVNDMLDLVRGEAERIDSRFLEPACGTGNFLVEILARKLKTVAGQYAGNRDDYEKYAILAVSSIYGVDILGDNVEESRRRMFDVFDAEYTRLFGARVRRSCKEAVRYILRRNIVHGDTLAMKTVGERPAPIVFSEWTLTPDGMIVRRDFAFHELVESSELPILAGLGEQSVPPAPIAEYPPAHPLRVSRAYGD